VSVLRFPRLYLRGQMSWDPSVTNNEGRPDRRAYDRGTTDAVFRTGEDVETFRARMINTTVLRGDWNYFGTHRCALESATVIGGTLEPGPADVTADPVLAAPVHLVGKLVDIDPYGVVSQIFFDELVVGVPGLPPATPCRGHRLIEPRKRVSADTNSVGRSTWGR
jgi:hypothetical protein